MDKSYHTVAAVNAESARVWESVCIKAVKPCLQTSHSWEIHMINPVKLVIQLA